MLHPDTTVSIGHHRDNKDMKISEQEIKYATHGNKNKEEKYLQAHGLPRATFAYHSR
jgi:hypothetical protein